MEEDILDELEPYFDELGYDPEVEEDKIRELYDIFFEDFIENPFQVNGITIAIKDELSEHKGQPRYFGEFHHDFVHTITRRSDITKLRCFEPNRANHIHWIKPILLNCNDKRIKYYQFEETDGKIRDYFWFEAKNFIVIIEKILPDYWLVSAHVIDDGDRKHIGRYKMYNEGKKKA